MRFPTSAAGVTANLGRGVLVTGRRLETDEVNLAANQFVWVGPDPNGVPWIRSPKDGALLGELRLRGMASGS